MNSFIKTTIIENMCISYYILCCYDDYTFQKFLYNEKVQYNVYRKNSISYINNKNNELIKTVKILEEKIKNGDNTNIDDYKYVTKIYCNDCEKKYIEVQE
jgi:hypothetical protein